MRTKNNSVPSKTFKYPLDSYLSSVQTKESERSIIKDIDKIENKKYTARKELVDSIEVLEKADQLLKKVQQAWGTPLNNVPSVPSDIGSPPTPTNNSEADEYTERVLMATFQSKGECTTTHQYQKHVKNHPRCHLKVPRQGSKIECTNSSYRSNQNHEFRSVSQTAGVQTEQSKMSYCDVAVNTVLAGKLTNSVVEHIVHPSTQATNTDTSLKELSKSSFQVQKLPSVSIRPSLTQIVGPCIDIAEPFKCELEPSIAFIQMVHDESIDPVPVTDPPAPEVTESAVPPEIETIRGTIGELLGQVQEIGEMQKKQQEELKKLGTGKKRILPRPYKSKAQLTVTREKRTEVRAQSSPRPAREPTKAVAKEAQKPGIGEQSRLQNPAKSKLSQQMANVVDMMEELNATGSHSSQNYRVLQTVIKGLIKDINDELKATSPRKNTRRNSFIKVRERLFDDDVTSGEETGLFEVDSYVQHLEERNLLKPVSANGDDKDSTELDAAPKYDSDWESDVSQLTQRTKSNGEQSEEDPPSSRSDKDTQSSLKLSEAESRKSKLNSTFIIDKPSTNSQDSSDRHKLNHSEVKSSGAARTSRSSSEEYSSRHELKQPSTSASESSKPNQSEDTDLKIPAVRVKTDDASSSSFDSHLVKDYALDILKVGSDEQGLNGANPLKDSISAAIDTTPSTVKVIPEELRGERISQSRISTNTRGDKSTDLALTGFQVQKKEISHPSLEVQLHDTNPGQTNADHMIKLKSQGHNEITLNINTPRIERNEPTVPLISSIQLEQVTERVVQNVLERKLEHFLKSHTSLLNSEKSDSKQLELPAKVIYRENIAVQTESLVKPPVQLKTSGTNSSLILSDREKTETQLNVQQKSTLEIQNGSLERLLPLPDALIPALSEDVSAFKTLPQNDASPKTTLEAKYSDPQLDTLASLPQNGDYTSRSTSAPESYQRHSETVNEENIRNLQPNPMDALSDCSSSTCMCESHTNSVSEGTDALKLLNNTSENTTNDVDSLSIADSSHVYMYDSDDMSEGEVRGVPSNRSCSSGEVIEYSNNYKSFGDVTEFSGNSTFSLKKMYERCSTSTEEEAAQAMLRHLQSSISSE